MNEQLFLTFAFREQWITTVPDMGTKFKLNQILRFSGTKPSLLFFFIIYVQVEVEVEGLHWGAEARFELGAALQQPNALPTNPRRTQPSHAAP